MEMSKKGHCLNFGNCPKADRREIIELSFTEDFVCPECQQDLMEIANKSKLRKKPLIIGGGILVFLIVLAGAAYLFSAKSKLEKITKLPEIAGGIQMPEPLQPDNENPQPDTEASPSDADSPGAEKEKEKVQNEPPAGGSQISMIPSLEDYLMKIGDKSIPYGDKEKLKEEVISSYFATGDVQIIDIGKNNTDVGHTKAIDFMEELSQQYYRIKIVKQEANSQKKNNQTLY